MKSLHLRVTLISAVALVVLPAGRSFGWYEAGHKIVASIAFRQLTPDEQAAIAAILKRHPRFEEDFQSKMPEAAASDAEQNEWLLQQGAIWPDLARKFTGDALKEYNRPTWHYFTVPNYLSDADRTALEGALEINSSVDAPATAEEKMNIVQTIRLARRQLVDPSTADDQKAVLLCWLLHTVGDIHQPLHSTSLYAKNLFPTGDRGGSILKTEQRQNLHFVWDAFPGDHADLREARNRALAMIQEAAQSGIGETAATNLDEKQWLDESQQLAVSVGYDSEVLGYLRGYASETQAPPLPLSEHYLKTGGDIAHRRVIEAGYRLGAVLKQIATERSPVGLNK